MRNPTLLHEKSADPPYSDTGLAQPLIRYGKDYTL